MSQYESLRLHCKVLRLPTIREVARDTIARAERESWSFEAFLMHLLEQELEGRRRRRIERLQKASHLPPGKTLDQLDESRLPLRVRRMLPRLRNGALLQKIFVSASLSRSIIIA